MDAASGGSPSSHTVGAGHVPPAGGEDPLTILRLFGERLAVGDAEGAAALFTPDAEYDEPPAHAFRGRDALRDFIAAFAAAHSDVSFEVVRALAGPDGVALAAEWRWSYTRTGDGTRRVFAGMCFVDVREGLIARWRGFSARME